MKICEIIPDLESGGAENFVVNLSNELATYKNVEIEILTFYPIPKDNYLYKKLSNKIKITSYNKKLGIDFRVLFWVYKHIRKNKIDIAHFHVQSIIYALFSVFMQRRCKCFATIHNNAYKEASGIHRLARRLMFKSGQMIPITISEESKRSFVELYGGNPALVYNGVPNYIQQEEVDMGEYRRDDNTQVFIQVATIQPVKNQVAVAKTFNKLHKDGYNATVVFVGRLKDKEYSEELLKESSSAVFVLGEKSNPCDYMKASDYFILASHYEGMPISLLEALSVGCIPVVTPVGGNVNVITDNYNGYIIPATDVDSIYHRIIDVLEEQEEKKLQIQGNIRYASSKYSISECAKLHLSLFDSYLS